MTCDDIRPKLTAYLEGELEDDRGTVVRGHLRTCEECRTIATREATLRDELRALPTIDPPSSLWEGVQARLAQEEVAEANMPSWRRWVTRFGRLWSPAMLPRAAVGGLLVAATITIVAWRLRPEPTDPTVTYVPPTVIGPEHRIDLARCTPSLECPTQLPPESTDVSDDLALDTARTNATYCQAVAELETEVCTQRTRWSTEQTSTFDRKLVELHAAVTSANDGRPRQLALRTLVRYLRGAVVREDIAMASIGGTR